MSRPRQRNQVCSLSIYDLQLLVNFKVLILETVFSFHLLDTLVLLQQHCKVNDTNFAQFLQAVDGKEVLFSRNFCRYAAII